MHGMRCYACFSTILVLCLKENKVSFRIDRSCQVTYVALELGFQSPEHIRFFSSALCSVLFPKVCISPNSHAEVLMPKVRILGNRTLKRYLGHENGTLMNGTSAHIKRSTELPGFACHVRTEREVCHPEGGYSQAIPMPWS